MAIRTLNSEKIPIIKVNNYFGVWNIQYNPFLVYYRELASGTVSLTGDRAQGDDSKHDSHYTYYCV